MTAQLPNRAGLVVLVLTGPLTPTVDFTGLFPGPVRLRRALHLSSVPIVRKPPPASQSCRFFTQQLGTGATRSKYQYQTNQEREDRDVRQSRDQQARGYTKQKFTK